MKIWETLVGVREDLPSLRQKWWHKLAIVFWFASTFVMFFVAAGTLYEGPVPPTPDNVFSLSLITFAKGRPGQLTQLTDLIALRGTLAIQPDDGELKPLTVAPPPENIRCEAPARLKAHQTLLEKDSGTGARIVFTAIADYVGQPEGEPRHCAASPAYASLVGQQVVSYRLNGVAQRWRSGRLAGKALVVAVIWLVLCLNVYYRGIVSIYAARRQRRIRRPSQSR